MFPSSHLSGNKLVLEKTTAKHAGRYSCMAGSWLKDLTRVSSSGEVQVTVKAYVSTPRISFSISKVGSTYSANVTCWSSTGSPPVNFSLTLDNRHVGFVSAAESLDACFSVDMVPGQDMGLARCHVKTDVQELKSEPVVLEVVPVGGSVRVEVEYLYTAESKVAGARLHCHVSAGTFPYFSWLFNDSVLPALEHHMESVHSHYTLAGRRRTLILTELDPHRPEYYRCQVRNSYDDSSPWLRSAAVKVQVADRTRPLDRRPPSSTPAPPNAVTTETEVIAIIFCCFLLLVLVVGVACACRMHDLQVMKLRRANEGAA
ncbi:uncharacterized protein LOC117525629 isoform X4 [Thalassophryne amazonica]|nr:uncharacterized protein LOC117525629 isoform X4 [Thalassophryne amazonica]